MALTDGANGNFVATMPMQPMYGGYGGGYSGGGGLFGGTGAGGDWLGILFLIALLNGGFGGWGMGMGGMMWPMMMGGMAGGGFGGIDYLYPWLNNSEHISDGFRDQQLSNQISGLRSDVTGGFSNVQLSLSGLGRQICETGNGITGAVRDGFYGAEVAAQGRHNALTGQLYQSEINALNRSFQEQTANVQGFNNVQAGLADAKYIEATEACATRTAAAQNTRDIIDNQTRVGQAILDKLCALELASSQRETEAERRENQNLRSQLSMAQFAASQAAQTATFQQGLNNEVDALYNRLKNCPVNTVPVYGNQPIFTCPQSYNSGCGCGGNGVGFVG